jgi:hypothetical protein
LINCRNRGVRIHSETRIVCSMLHRRVRSAVCSMLRLGCLSWLTTLERSPPLLSSSVCALATSRESANGYPLAALLPCGVHKPYKTRALWNMQYIAVGFYKGGITELNLELLTVRCTVFSTQSQSNRERVCMPGVVRYVVS